MSRRDRIVFWVADLHPKTNGEIDRCGFCGERACPAHHSGTWQPHGHQHYSATAGIEISGRDEVGILLSALDKMQNNLRTKDEM